MMWNYVTMTKDDETDLGLRSLAPLEEVEEGVERRHPGREVGRAEGCLQPPPQPLPEVRLPEADNSHGLADA